MLRFAAMIVALVLAAPVQAQDKAVKIVLGFPAGATSDLRMTDMGLEPTGYGATELGRVMKADYDKWGPVIKASGFKPTQ